MCNLLLNYIFKHNLLFENIYSRMAVKARVTNKSPIKTWSNSKGEGKLFSMDLLDETGEIRMTGFNLQVDMLYDLLKVRLRLLIYLLF